jgi:hypothetical protein
MGSRPMLTGSSARWAAALTAVAGKGRLSYVYVFLPAVTDGLGKPSSAALGRGQAVARAADAEPGSAMPGLFAADAEVGRDLAVVDWAATPLGLPGSWPQSLLPAVDILLSSRFAMWMAWGPQLTFFAMPPTGATPWAASTRGRWAGPPARYGRRSGPSRNLQHR